MTLEIPKSTSLKSLIYQYF